MRRIHPIARVDAWLLASSLIAFGCGPGAVDPETLKDKVVQIYCMDSDGSLVSTGSGFVMSDRRYAATNRHVAMLSAEKPCASFRVRRNSDRMPTTPSMDKYMAVLEKIKEIARETKRSAEDVLSDAKRNNAELRALAEAATAERAALSAALARLPSAKTAWVSKKTDVALLALDHESTVEPAPLAIESAAVVALGSPVFAVGFPGVVTKILADFGMQTAPEAIVMPGAIAARQDTGEGSVLQHNAEISGGNSGGPLFDRCGRVVGINTFGGGDGIGGRFFWAIRSDELLPGLKELGVEAKTSGSPCNPEAASSRLSYATNGLGVLAAVATLVIAARRRSREAIGHAFSRASSGLTRRVSKPRPRRDDRTSGRQAEVKAILCGVSGVLRETEIELDDSPVVLGRDPARANLVFPSDDAVVSRRHCSIRIDRERGAVILEDLSSSHGTYLAGGRRLSPGTPHESRTSFEFDLGSGGHRFRVEVKSQG